jgi:hypothetical protein
MYSPNRSLPLTPTHITQWKTAGYCVVSTFFPPDDYATADRVVCAQSTEDITHTCGFGSKDGCMEFPTDEPALNLLTLHPKLIRSCQVLLGSKDIRLIQSDVWSKTGRKVSETSPESNQDQRMHMDYPNNYLTYPNENWDTPDSVAIIVYFDDERKCGGGTRLVPRDGEDDPAYQHPFTQMPGLGDYPFFNDRAFAESYFRKHHPEVADFRQSLYSREQSVSFRPNTVLFYRHDVWHRGSPIRPGQRRVVMNIGFKKARCDWITCWNQGWARGLCWHNRKMQMCIRSASPLQRMCLGFPRTTTITPLMVDVMGIRYGGQGWTNEQVKSRL